MVLCATPIGNLEDITRRALRTLDEADAVACEDVGRTRKLLSHFGVGVKRLVVLNEGNERRQAGGLVARMVGGETVALVSDAGMPGLSDPGFHLVRSALDAGVDVEVVPGPTAVVSALVVSGLPPARFVFEGFLPRKRGERRRRAQELADERRTLVLFVSPHKLEETLEDLVVAWGDRPAALVRELTKLHEEVRREGLSALLAHAREHPARGELVLVVSGAIHEHRHEPPPEELARMATGLMRSGMDRKEALATVAHETGVARRRVFDALVDSD